MPVAILFLLLLWLVIALVCAVLILFVRPLIKIVISNPEISNEGVLARMSLALYELLVTTLIIEGMILPLPLVLLLSLPLPGRRKFLHRQGRFWTKVFLWLLCVKVKVEGRENIPAGPVIYVQKFNSYLDGAATLSYLPADFRFIFQRHLFEMPFLGWLERVMGFLALETEVITLMHDDTLEILKVLGRGESVVIFEARGGAAFLALHSRLPVVPVTITHQTTAPEVGAFLMKPYPYEITLRLGRPIIPTGAPDDRSHRQELLGLIQAQL